MIKFCLSLTLIVLLFSCSSNEKSKNAVVPAISFETETDNLNAALSKDTIVPHAAEVKENHNKIVQKFGEQWDFCTCVVANDSINDAFEKGGMNSKQEEKLMARWEYVDNKCKELTTNPSTTPEERAKHDKKVLKCLRQNGLKK